MKQAGIFLIAVMLLTGCSNFGKILKSNDVDYKYKKAVELYDKKKYNQAQQLFENIFPFLKGRKEFEDAFYMFAFCYYHQSDYFNAENLFRQFSEVFPKSTRVVEMDYMRAYTYYKQSPKVELEQTNTIKAISMLQQFINQHPDSEKAKEAADLIVKCREKLEAKEYQVAQLYYHMGQYKAAAASYAAVLNNFPESPKADDYKLMVIKSYYQYANLSVQEKKEERYEQVVNECNDFADKYPESKLLKEAERYLQLSKNNINSIKNEQTKKTTGS
ncbi:MAG: outer membrane protein assembly factor BamD [Dinghuibacter sp.]|nr:outer membrane protein assembly factor BamD [Dinghuibacter sp.]